MKSIALFALSGLLLGMPAASAALTAEEILLLKENGVSETTIQMMLESEIRAQSRPCETPQKTMGVKTIRRPDGREAIVYTTGRGNRDDKEAQERLKEEQAWEMLRHIIVDTRESED
ncbi:hypothetical protein [uncultured Desulfosarcina sp.]|uniref:hypothetical protein n=1 Tax=uncultured Desulfosarcina sp. TaxID=218289 RepID=UPI0029C81641|nr:hypothetical protein [uncultured Desulfosarcina sp.]